jgi:hypothetical protein
VPVTTSCVDLADRPIGELVRTSRQLERAESRWRTRQNLQPFTGRRHPGPSDGRLLAEPSSSGRSYTPRLPSAGFGLAAWHWAGFSCRVRCLVVESPILPESPPLGRPGRSTQQAREGRKHRKPGRGRLPGFRMWVPRLPLAAGAIPGGEPSGSSMVWRGALAKHTAVIG